MSGLSLKPRRNVPGFGWGGVWEVIGVSAILGLLPGAIVAAVLDAVRWTVGGSAPLALAAVVVCAAAGAIGGLVLWMKGGR